MSYEPTTWQAGDTITSSKLNKMEQGIAAGGQITVVHFTQDGNLLITDKTWQEIYNALEYGPVYTIVTGELANMFTQQSNSILLGQLRTVYQSGNSYFAIGDMGGNTITLSTFSSDAYLVYTIIQAT